MAEFKKALTTKKKEVKFLEGKAAEQYVEGFDTVIGQVKFLYLSLDVSSYSYFKEIWGGQLEDKPLPDNNLVGAEVVDQMKPSNDVVDPATRDEDEAVDQMRPSAD